MTMRRSPVSSVLSCAVLTILVLPIKPEVAYFKKFGEYTDRYCPSHTVETGKAESKYNCGQVCGLRNEAYLGFFYNSLTKACACVDTVEFPETGCSVDLWNNYYVKQVCVSGSLQEYRGTWSRTASGRVCQRWDRQYPHAHVYWAGGFPPGETETIAVNYCRDPTFYGDLWCYTMDPDERWEVCGVPSCNSTDFK